MAIPNCPRCKGTFFEIQQTSPTGGNYKIMLVNCISCGCVVGTQPFINTAALIEQLAKKLNITLQI